MVRWTPLDSFIPTPSTRAARFQDSLVSTPPPQRLDPPQDGARPRTVARVRDLATIVLFAAALLAPSVDALWRPSSERDPTRYEMRVAAVLPRVPDTLARLENYPRRLENWHDDRLGLRDVMLRWRSIARLFVFGVTPAPDVLPGKNGFLFYTANHTLEMLRGMHPFSAAELDAWVELLEARRALCERAGARYLFVIGPNKESIYPDFLPPGYDPVGPTRLDQLVRAVRERTRVEFLDLRPALLAARERDKPRRYLYNEPGTHWDGRGNFIAYRAVAGAWQRHFPAVVPFEGFEVRRVHVNENADSWGLRMYVQDLLDPRGLWIFPPPGRERAVIVDDSQDFDAVHRWRVDDPTLPKVLLFNDSFGGGLIRLLAQHCREFVFTLRPTADPELVAAEKPDLVMELWVERVLDAWNPRVLMPREAAAPVPAPARPADAGKAR